MGRRARMTNAWANDRGIALPLALMALVLLTLMALALLSIGTTEVQIARNHYVGTEALYLADAGFEDALHALIASCAGNSNCLAAAPSPPGLSAVPGLAGAGLANVGTYTVQYQAAGTNTALIISTGTTTNSGASQTVRALVTVTANTFTSTYALLTGGNLISNGSWTINGSCGAAHTNGTLTIANSPTLTQSFTASGTISNSGSPKVAGTVFRGPPPVGSTLFQQNTATVTIPTIAASEFLTAAEATVPLNTIYSMSSSGKITDGNNTLLGNCNTANGAIVNCGGGKYTDSTGGQWQYQSGSPAIWSMSSTTAASGVYYFDGNVVLNNVQDAWNVTILATGTLQFNGSGGGTHTANITPVLRDTALVSNSDMKITGTPTLAGLLATNEQVELDNSPLINGFIIAKAKTSTNGLVVNDDINGSPTINYSCNLHPPLTGLGGNPSVLTWGR